MDTLPDEVLALILASLPCAVVRATASSVCRRWRCIALDPSSLGRHPCLVRPPNAQKCDPCADAARHGHLDCLIYARAKGHRWGMDTCCQAAAGGHLACLVYAHRNGCRWNGDECEAAAGHGHIDCLRYLAEHGCPVYSWTCVAAASGGHLDCMIFLAKKGALADDICRHAASSGSVACLTWLDDHGFAWDASTCANAAGAGSLACVTYVRERGCPWDASTLTEAVRSGNADLVRYVVTNGCPRDDAACLKAAVVYGGLPVLCVLLDAGVVLAPDAVCLAAHHGRIVVIAEAHARGFIDTRGDVCHAAAAQGQLEALTLARECGWDWGGARTCEAALDHNDATALVEYVREHGCRCISWRRRFAPARRRRLVARNAPDRRRARCLDPGGDAPRAPPSTDRP
nr:Ankyrin repeat domain containing protein [Pandoravirus belohorizontensis]